MLTNFLFVYKFKKKKEFQFYESTKFLVCLNNVKLTLFTKFSKTHILEIQNFEPLKSIKWFQILISKFLSNFKIFNWKFVNKKICESKNFELKICVLKIMSQNFWVKSCEF